MNSNSILNVDEVYYEKSYHHWRRNCRAFRRALSASAHPFPALRHAEWRQEKGKCGFRQSYTKKRRNSEKRDCRKKHWEDHSKILDIHLKKRAKPSFLLFISEHSGINHFHIVQLPDINVSAAPSDKIVFPVQ
jgi:hypothetical protein